MNGSMKLILSTAFAFGVWAFASGGVSAMPVTKMDVNQVSGVEQAHAVRVCNRWGRCWWSYTGHYHGGYYGWRRPYYGWRGGHWGWRGHGWRGHGWRGHGWHGHGWHGHRHGWHGGRRHWR